MSDIREALNAAFDTAEKPAEAPPTEAPPASVEPTNPPIGEETQAQRDERARDEKGRFAKADEKAPSEPKEPAKEPTPPKEAAKPATPPEPQPEAAPTFAKEGARAPQSWKPAVREKFAALTPEVQEEVVRIDREVRRTMQESAEARQVHQRIRETFAPAEPYLRAQGVDPLTFTQNAVQTAMALAGGTQAVKAQALVQLIKTYGVDIKALDDALVGGGAPTQPGQPEVYRDPRVDDLLRTVEQAKVQRQQQLEAQARAAIAEVEGQEFFEDVRLDMADLLDLAGRRGVALTPMEAYRRATLMHPEVSKVLQQREAARLAANPNGSTQRARAAAASVRASPAGPSIGGPEDRDLRGELEAAWDQVTRTR